MEQVEFRDSRLAQYIIDEARRTGESQDSIKRDLLERGKRKALEDLKKNRGR